MDVTEKKQTGHHPKNKKRASEDFSALKAVESLHTDASLILLILLNHFYNSEMEVNNDAWGYVFRLLSFIVDFFFR